MSKAHDRGRLDWLVEVAGASAPAAAAAFAAAKLAPANGWPPGTAVLVGFGVVFALAYIAMRVVPAEVRHLALPDFDDALLLDEVLVLDEVIGDDELLLDVPYVRLDELLLDRPLVEAGTKAVAELLLDDPLPAPTPDSRVVQLFAAGRMPTAGQLKQRIDRHLAEGDRPAVSKDASDALSEALAELRRSLRQA